MANKKKVYTWKTIQTHCRHDILLIPVFMYAISFWAYLNPTEMENATSQWVIPGLLFIFSLYLTYLYGREVAVSLKTQNEMLVITWFGRFERVYCIEDITNIRCSSAKGVTQYRVFIGKKSIALFSTFSANAEKLFDYLLEQNPKINVKYSWI